MPTTFANTINGNPIYAARALSDKDGNQIDTTYAKLSDIPPGVTVDQTYNSSSTNAQSGTAVAGAIASVNQVPASTSADEDKVLTVDSNGDPVWADSQGAPQVQANWNETDTSDPSYIQNKPTIPAAQVNSDWNSSSGVSQILNKPTLATVATTGDYSDLTNKPTIPSVDQTYNASSTNAQSGTAVAGAIANVRQVPTTQSTDNGKVLGVTDANGTLGWVAQSGGGGTQVQADWTETDSTDPSYIQHKPTELGLSAGTNITLTESGNSLTISANFTQVQSDWDETNTASPAYLDNKPLITRVIPGALSENSTNSNLMDICDLVDQYSSSGDVLMVKGSWSGTTDAMWRFIEKFQSGQDTYTYLFKLVVEDPITAYVYILYDTARPTAYIDYSSTYRLSTQTLYNGRCININYNQSTQQDEINWTTTAGITDIQQVASLPANPVSTVLYLIPAT